MWLSSGITLSIPDKLNLFFLLTGPQDKQYFKEICVFSQLITE